MPFEPRDQYFQRRNKLSDIEALGFAPYPHRFEGTHTVAAILEDYASRTATDLEAERPAVRFAARLISRRLHGKAGFAHLVGQGKRLQIYVKLDTVGNRAFELFRLLDLGDFVGVAGHLFRTKTNELTVWVETLVLLSKALLPLPEKWHGLADVDLRYRRRYLDLIANERVREIFEKRALLMRELRKFFDARGYLEVETPMMHPVAGGAVARPFITHHNTYDIDLYLRVAPELYLKRLIVGGFDRVYEINRSFRNEGVGYKYNPEFTMLEFYQAYSDYGDLMGLTEELLAGLVRIVCGGTKISFGGYELDFSRFERISLREAISRYWPAGAGPAPETAELAAQGGPRTIAARYNIWARGQGVPTIESSSATSDGEWSGLLFEAIAEAKLIQPTLLYDFPTEISPLSKQKDDDPSLVERFELFVAGMEIANAFSELNDPEEQERRFREQIARDGEGAPKQLDLDYLRALAHGMPPTAGEGVGIDRLMMLFTNSHSIREVILFPLLRPEAPDSAGASSPGEGENDF